MNKSDNVAELEVKNNAALKTGRETIKCGLIMPISAIDGCPEQHWKEVRQIISNSIQDVFEDKQVDTELVSRSDDVGVIQEKIIQNLYYNPIVICDVSGKNPNVMFELGLRLAFDKPTIVIKDDKTPYSFDTSPIEHLEYPRDLRYTSIEVFKKKLREKVKATLQKADSDPNYSTFLKYFGKFTVAKIDEKEVSSETFMMKELDTVKSMLSNISNQRLSIESSFESKKFQDLCEQLNDLTLHLPDEIAFNLEEHTDYYNSIYLQLASKSRLQFSKADFDRALEDIMFSREIPF